LFDWHRHVAPILRAPKTGGAVSRFKKPMSPKSKVQSDNGAARLSLDFRHWTLD
jgi:hypothetical protein